MVAESLRMVLAQSLLPRADGRGRVGCFELLLCIPAVSNLVKENKLNQISGVMQTQAGLGMRTHDMALRQLLDARLITAEEAYLRAVRKENFVSEVEEPRG